MGAQRYDEINLKYDIPFYYSEDNFSIINEVLQKEDGKLMRKAMSY